MNMWSALIDALKELIKGIPSWAKVVLSFAITAVVLTIAILNYKLLLVYDIHLEDPTTPAELRYYTIEHRPSNLVRRTDEHRRFDVYREAGIADLQDNIIFIRRQTVNTGAPVDEIRYAFVSKSWTSRVFSFDISCNFASKECTKLRTRSFESIDQAAFRGSRPISVALGPDRAEAAESKLSGVVVPTLATLRRVATEGGYMGISLRNIQVSGDPCRLVPGCKGVLYSEIEWNGKRLLYDGLSGESNGYFDVSVAADRKVVGEIVLAVENVLFTEAENQLIVKLFARKTGGDVSAADIFSQAVVLFRDISEKVIKSRGGHLQAELNARTYRDQLGRVYELFVASGTDERSIRALSETFHGRVQHRFQGMPVVGMLRPPLPPNKNWGLVVGLKSLETGRVRILFTQEEVRKLQTELAAYVTSQGIGALPPREWFPYKIRDIQ